MNITISIKSPITTEQALVGGNKDRIKDAPVLIVSTFERGKSGFFQGNQTNEVGYRAGEPNRPERRPLDEIVKFY